MRKPPSRLPLRAAALLALLLGACSGEQLPPPVDPPPVGEPPAPPPAEPPLHTVPSPPETVARVASLKAGGAASEPALREALASAGLAVRSLADGTTLVAPASPSQGLALAEYDPEALALLQASGTRVSLAELGAVLAQLLPGTDGAELASRLLQGLRTQASGSGPTLRSWAWLIVELGRQAPVPYDVLGEVTPEQVQLDSVQRTLLLLRLSGDLALHAQRHGVPLGLQRQQLQSTPVKQCTFSGVEGTLMDAAATGLTTGFGELLGYLDSVGISAAERASVMLATANITLAYLKLAFSLIVFNIDVDVDALPVVRTQSLSQDGEGPYTAKAKVYFDFGSGAQYLNCLRLGMNALGLDASVPNSGVVEGADIRWRLEGAEGPTGPDRYLEILQYLAGEEVMHDKTDAAGLVDVRFEARRQRKNVGSSATPVHKRGQVLAITALKAANVAGDLVDAVGTVLGAASAGITIVPELFNRMCPLSGSLEFPITDWVPSAAGGTSFFYVDREWAHADQVASGSTVSTPLFDPDTTLPVGEGSAVALAYQVMGSGTYVGVKGPADEPDYCLGRWTGTWTETLFIEDVRLHEDGSVSMLAWRGAADQGEGAASTEADCEVWSGSNLPWTYGVDIYNDLETERLVFPPGVESLTVSATDPHFGSQLRYALDFRGMLPRP
ncbi:MAG TPA: hypothetical protein VFO83_02700 [Aggregicoccus sp.]|nr:hypothetical protein [Aggregicoccus sp.]